MKTISTEDVLYITAQHRGVVLANMQMSGAGSMADITRQIRNIITGCCGLVNINLRNVSQGWSRNYNVCATA